MLIIASQERSKKGQRKRNSVSETTFLEIDHQGHEEHKAEANASERRKQQAHRVRLLLFSRRASVTQRPTGAKTEKPPAGKWPRLRWE
jgi:hypothetical protein